MVNFFIAFHSNKSYDFQIPNNSKCDYIYVKYYIDEALLIDLFSFFS